MHIEKLEISNIRNLKLVDIEPSDSFNLIEGSNGSGKTSLLEAIYLLSAGRSFRTNRISNVITHGFDHCFLFSKLHVQPIQILQQQFIATQSFTRKVNVGLEKRADGKTLLKVDGQFQKSFTEIANMAPIQVIAPELENLIDASPNERRQVMDWGVFHVEHSFHEAWRKVKKAINQRNALLRAGINDELMYLPWEELLLTYGEQLTNFRQKYIALLADSLNEIANTFGFERKVDISFYKGWPLAKTLQESLSESRDIDRLRKYTTLGPHKADIRIKVDGNFAKDFCSRGQKKVLSSAIQLSQIQLLEEYNQKKSVVLVDDLSSELDKNNRKKFCDLLSKMNVQVFITCVCRSDIEEFLPIETAKMFHVKHGVVYQIQQDIAVI